MAGELITNETDEMEENAPVFIQHLRLEDSESAVGRVREGHGQKTVDR